MSLLKYSRDRVREFLTEIERLRQSEFPYQHSSDLLDELHGQFRQRLNTLTQFDSQSDQATVKGYCADSLGAMFECLPYTGIALRSTNVRNAFEVYGPLFRMARAVLEPGKTFGQHTTKLLLSSGWDYSPLIYSDAPDLPNYVLIEFPASESSNPLLLPLAGHELGHSLWLKKDLGRALESEIHRSTVGSITAELDRFRQVFRLQATLSATDLETDTTIQELYEPAEIWLASQATETFCDFVGLRLFGSSFLSAFAYLLSPSLSLYRSESYPNWIARVANITAAAAEYGTAVPGDYSSWFRDDPEPPHTEANRFLLSIADRSLCALAPVLRQRARDLVEESGVTLSSANEVNRIAGRMRIGVPAEATKGLPDIINAAWQLYDSPDLWADMPAMKEKRDYVLKELTLKNIELYEIELRQNGEPL